LSQGTSTGTNKKQAREDKRGWQDNQKTELQSCQYQKILITCGMLILSF